MKNKSKIDQESIKIRSTTIDQNQRPERVWVDSGYWGGSWAILEASMVPTWMPRGSKKEKKNDAKLDEKIKLLESFFFGGFGDAK